MPFRDPGSARGNRLFLSYVGGGWKQINAALTAQHRHGALVNLLPGWRGFNFKNLTYVRSSD